MSPSKAGALMLAAAALVAVAPAGATEYEIRLQNGNVFTTRYAPIEAPFDAGRLMFMTLYGNTMTVAKDQVAEVVSLLDASGFGRRIDEMTVLIGIAPNDNPTPEEEAALAAQGLAPEPATPYSIPLVTEPDQTGGIPLQFLNLNTPPLGGAGFSGSAADLRRGQGGTQFVEPQTRD